MSNIDFKVDFYDFIDYFSKRNNYYHKQEKNVTIYYQVLETLIIENGQKDILYKFHEILHYLNQIYNDIDFNCEEMRDNDFIISAIIFTELYEIIKIFFQKINSNAFKSELFNEIILNDIIFHTDQVSSIEKPLIDKNFIIRIGAEKNSSNKQEYNEIDVFKCIRNKLIHPNGDLYNKIHIFGVPSSSLSCELQFGLDKCKNAFLFNSSIEDNYSCDTFLVKNIYF